MITLSTISPENIEVNLTATEEQDFFVKNDILYDATISPSEARYYYYSFNENSSDTVIIEVDSEDDICLTVSVQEASVSKIDFNEKQIKNIYSSAPFWILIRISLTKAIIRRLIKKEP